MLGMVEYLLGISISHPVGHFSGYLAPQTNCLEDTMDLALRRAWATLQSDGPTAKTPRGPSGLVPAGRWGWDSVGDGCPTYGDCTSVCEVLC